MYDTFFFKSLYFYSKHTIFIFAYATQASSFTVLFALLGEISETLIIATDF